MKSKMSFLSIIILMTMCSCGDIKGSWVDIDATQSNIKTTVNTTVAPFNTVMSLKYFINEDNDVNKDEIIKSVTSLYDYSVGKYHKLFDRHYYYYEDNGVDIVTNLKTINDSFGTNTPIKCSDELYELLKISVEAFELTNGYFNIFTGALTDYWNYIFSEVDGLVQFVENYDPYYNEVSKNTIQKIVDSIPNTKEEIQEQLTFDDENKTVTFNKLEKNSVTPLISLGGVAKGFATDLLKDLLVSNEYKDGYLFSGGSSISSLSTPIFTKKNKGQNISVIDPIKSGYMNSVKAFSLKFSEEFNFSTSGNYTSGKSYSFVVNDELINRHHIINPFTGYPESYYTSVSISTNNLSNAFVDILSTALMNVDIEKGKIIRNNVLSRFPDATLDVYYLIQTLKDDSITSSLYATSDNDGTLEVGEGIKVTYEE